MDSIRIPCYNRAMNTYSPPFTITNKMLHLVSEISETVGKLEVFRSFDSKPYLRRNNRIQSIHSSLAIESNALSPEQVRSVINGQTVIGPEKEIREVQNAYTAYEMLGNFDPYSLKDLQKLHGIMTDRLLSDSGTFRNHGEGVFDGDICIFMAPPAQFVPQHMQNLFEWMTEERQTLHPLILSSAFHYEFVFIHPFSDGNGRMARLWQTALLSEWNPLFHFLPVESEIKDFQNGYYEAIAVSHEAGNCNVFIEFMLQMIKLTVERTLKQVSEKEFLPQDKAQKLLDCMEFGVQYTAKQLMEKLSLKSKDNFRNLYLNPALEKNLITMGIPDKPTSRNQTYMKI